MGRHVAPGPLGGRQIVLVAAVIAAALFSALGGYLVVAAVFPENEDPARAASDPLSDRPRDQPGDPQSPTADGSPTKPQTPTPTATQTPSPTPTRSPTPTPRQSPREPPAESDAGDPEVAFQSSNRAKDGFVTRVTIVNNTNEPLTWVLGFGYDNAVVDDSWDAVVEQSGDQVTARGVDGTAQIAPGERVRFGFSGTGEPSGPNGCTLNGSRCVFRGG